MSHIKYPEEYVGLRKLQQGIKKKVDADGATSPLLPYLAMHGIDLAFDEAQGVLADEQNEISKQKSKDAEKLIGSRNFRFDLVFGRFEKEVQNLKALYNPEFHKLGDWTIDVQHTDKIVYPVDFTGRAKGFMSFKEHHDSLLPNSPLSGYLTERKIDIDLDFSNTKDAIADNEGSDAASKDSEKATAQREFYFNLPEDNIHGICDYLMSFYTDNQKALGDYGVEVNDSPQAPKTQKTSLILGAKKTKKGIVLGSSISNIGTTDIDVYKGETTLGEKVTVKPGDKLGLGKGFSTITVMNPSTTETATFTTVMHKS